MGTTRFIDISHETNLNNIVAKIKISGEINRTHITFYGINPIEFIGDINRSYWVHEYRIHTEECTYVNKMTSKEIIDKFFFDSRKKIKCKVYDSPKDNGLFSWLE